MVVVAGGLAVVVAAGGFVVVVVGLGVVVVVALGVVVVTGAGFVVVVTGAATAVVVAEVVVAAEVVTDVAVSSVRFSVSVPFAFAAAVAETVSDISGSGCCCKFSSVEQPAVQRADTAAISSTDVIFLKAFVICVLLVYIFSQKKYAQGNMF